MRFLSRRRVVFSLLIGVPLALFFVAWRAASWRPIVRQVAATPILALQWAPDGKTIRCASGNGDMKTLAASSLETLSSRNQGGNWQQAELSNNGLLFFMRGDKVRLLEFSSGRILWQDLPGSRFPELSESSFDWCAIALSPNGGSLAYSQGTNANGTGYLLQVRSGRVFAEPKGLMRRDGAFYQDLIEAMALSPNGTLAYDTDGMGISLWVNDKSVSLPIPALLTETGTATLAFSPDGNILAADHRGGGVVLWSVSKRRINRILPTPNLVVGQDTPLVFSHDGKNLAVASRGGICDVWDVASGQRLRQMHASRFPITALAFAPDGSRLAIGTSDGQVQLWRLQ